KLARERRMLRKDGTSIWTLVTSSVVRKQDRTPKYFILAYEDITKRKQIEESFRHVMKDLTDVKRALDQSSIVAVTGESGVILGVNDQFCEISKYSREELLGKTHALVNSAMHTREFFGDLWSAISSGRIWRGEIQNRAKDGSLYWVDTVIVPSLGPTGK